LTFGLVKDHVAQVTHSATDRLPVTVLTGFLGSGKTTLLNAWLRSPELSDAAVIVNEFGEIGIDHSLIASSNDNTIELSTGCLCCTVRGDLVETLRELTEKRARGDVRPFSRILIETTGLADPVPVLQALITMPVARLYRLSRVVTVVDAVQGLGTIERHPEALKQVAVADDIVLSKTDLEAPLLPMLKTRLRQINPGAGQQCSSSAKLHDGLDIYDPAAKPEQVMDWLKAESFHGGDAHHEHGHHGHDVNRHSRDITSFCLSYDEPLHWEHVAAWLDALVMAHGEDLLRVKGLLNVHGQKRPIVVQTVQRLFHPPAPLSSWPDDQHRSRIVFITRGLSRNFVCEVFDTIRTRLPAATSY
jgi:G3E family GTPase